MSRPFLCLIWHGRFYLRVIGPLFSCAWRAATVESDSINANVWTNGKSKEPREYNLRIPISNGEDTSGSV